VLLDAAARHRADHGAVLVDGHLRAGGIGAERCTATTVATATRSPRAVQSATSFRTSVIRAPSFQARSAMQRRRRRQRDRTRERSAPAGWRQAITQAKRAATVAMQHSVATSLRGVSHLSDSRSACSLGAIICGATAPMLRFFRPLTRDQAARAAGPIAGHVDGIAVRPGDLVR
jgi:hypothetical protein